MLAGNISDKDLDNIGNIIEIYYLIAGIYRLEQLKIKKHLKHGKMRFRTIFVQRWAY